MQSTLFAPLGHSRSTLCKRATLTVGHLIARLPDDIFEDLLHKILNGLETSKDTPDRLRTCNQVTGAISCSNPQRFGKLLSKITLSVIDYTELDDDELFENSLQALEALVICRSTEITPHNVTAIDLDLNILRHDRNYDGDDGDNDKGETMESDNEDDEKNDDGGDYSDNVDMS
ncbi:Cullin-associated NEDD8-dissociated protein 1 [Mortierella sp. NVP85]|nr:Cullin-associated NEDD8-dissociated protein 1 [Mortierella sp. NVP85]